MNKLLRHIRTSGGLTLIEVAMVVIIGAILVTVAMKALMPVAHTARVEETKREMEQLSWAICGNPTLENNGIRTDFGYVGDVGSLPAGLDSLYEQPSGYLTWNGPYVQKRFAQITHDHRQDAWGVDYLYNGGVEIVSTGSGSNIVRKLANTTSDLLSNQVTGVVLDRDGAPPGNDEADSVIILLTIPNGTGSTITKTTHPSAGGHFAFDSIPIGNHNIDIVYIPAQDTLHRFVSVLPGSVLYQEYFFPFRAWSQIPPTAGCFAYVENSAVTISSAGSNCDGIQFQILNTCGFPASAESITLDWGASPVAFWQNMQWNSEAAYSGTSDRVGSGELADFRYQKTVKWAEAGQVVTIKIQLFKDTETGTGNPVNMSNVNMTITLSDGSSFAINTGTCIGG